MNLSGLKSAISAPAQTFDGRDLWPDILFKAAALFRSLVMNHPFVDGNKRTAVLAVVRFLGYNGYRMRPNVESKLIELALETARQNEPEYRRKGPRLQSPVQRIRDKLAGLVVKPPPTKPKQIELGRGRTQGLKS